MKTFNVICLTSSELAILKQMVANAITDNLQQLENETRDKAYFWESSNPNEDTARSRNSYEWFRSARNQQSKLKQKIAKLTALQKHLKVLVNGYSV